MYNFIELPLKVLLSQSADCRDRPRVVIENAKRVTAMTSSGQFTCLRKVALSSEIINHPKHRRNEARYKPVKNACTTAAMASV